MADTRAPETVRRSVVPQAAGRSIWLSAVWTGAGTALVAATVAIAAVAVCWLPASHGSGNATSAIKAGLLTFLASVHGGVTVDATPAQFLPLGMTVLLGLIAWRAGCGLADAAEDIDEVDSVRLVLAGAAQAASFVASCLILVPIASLGTSDAPFLGVGFFALLLFAGTGGVGFVRYCALGARMGSAVPEWVRAGARVAVSGVAVFLCAGAFLVAGSLAVHHAEVERVTTLAGPGWNGAPVLLLSILAAPNAIIAAASYLAGPGFAVGTGTTVGVTATTHGLLPAFPVLAALPDGASSAWMWWPVLLTPVVAGLFAGAVALRERGWLSRFRSCAVGAAFAALIGMVLAWQGGGGIGDGRLQTIGASPWLFGLAVGGELAAGAALTVALGAGWAGVRDFVHETRTDPPAQPVLRPAPVDPEAITERIEMLPGDLERDQPGDAGDAHGGGRLAG